MKLKSLTLNTKGFTTVEGLLALVLVVAIATVGWYVYDRNKNNESPKASTPGATVITNFEQCKKAGYPIAESYPEQCSANGQTFVNQAQRPADEEKLSANWLLHESSDKTYSIRVPDGFNILTSAEGGTSFVLPDAPPGTLKYQKGVKAKIVGEPHKHFELGLMVGFGQHGFNDRGTRHRQFTTYSGLSVQVKLFEKKEEPTGVDFPKGAKHLKYLIAKDTKFIEIDYVYLGEGIVDIIEEMVKTAKIR